MMTFKPYPKIAPIIKAKKPLKYTRKPTGELALFKQIAEKVPHVSFISGVRIESLTASNFHHCISKGSAPEYRLCPENIVIVTLDEHRLLHNLPMSELIKLNPRYGLIFEIAEKLKKEMK